MSEISAKDAAAYILEKKGKMTTLKLQKLLYYCQAWSLVWDEEPLFYEKIEAWANGPVIRDVFSVHRNQFKITKMNGNPDNLSNLQKESINEILRVYGDKNSQWLADLTHAEDPWKTAREGLLPGERSNREISHAAMAEYYSSL